jgi:hypothetical protein
MRARVTASAVAFLSLLGTFIVRMVIDSHVRSTAIAVLFVPAVLAASIIGNAVPVIALEARRG